MKLVTLVSVADPDSRRVNLRCLLSIELDDGERVPLLADRGWGTTELWAQTTMAELEDVARMVSGPDDPSGDLSAEDAVRGYWRGVEREAKDRHVFVTAEQLADLPHHVEFNEDIFTRIEGVAGPE